MKRTILCMLAAVLYVLNPFAVNSASADCVSQYCACDGQMHPCDFSEAQCRELCGGGEPQYQTSYRNTDFDALYIGFAVAFAAIGVVLYFSGAFDEPQNSSAYTLVYF